MKILISTDTSCLVKADTFKNHDISVFPLNVLIDGVEYLDTVSINQDELNVAMRDKKQIKTSTPPMGVVIEYFENLFEKGYDRIIHFTISSKFSSMYSLFSTVSSNYFEDRITVIDAYSVSSAMLSLVFYAYDEVSKNTSIEDICKGIEERKPLSKIHFIPENLTALKNGGRISPTVAMIGNTLGLKPVISLVDGELVKESMTRNVKTSFYKLIDDFIDNNDYQNYDFTLINFDGKEQTVSVIENHINSKIGENKVVKGIIPINVCAHCGPGTIGVVITPKINGKSLKEFL